MLKAVERQGGKATQGQNLILRLEVQGQPIEIQIREKQKQVRRPLTEDEKRYWVAGEKDWRQELRPTGKLIFSMKTYLQGFQSEWVESGDSQLETQLPDIVVTLLAAGPALAERERQRKQEEHERHVAQLKRYEEEQRQKLEKDRWREFNNIARQWRDTQLAREFVAAVKGTVYDPGQKIGDRTIGDWLAWVEENADYYDPIRQGVGPIFGSVFQVSPWTRKD